jgi:hypothetical protein
MDGPSSAAVPEGRNREDFSIAQIFFCQRSCNRELMTQYG